MQALLEVKTGEQIYKFMNSEWLSDDAGVFMYRFISKLRIDGQVELVLFKQRQDNRKEILDELTFPEVEFLGMVQEIRQSIWQRYPDARIEVMDMNDIPADKVHTVKNTFFGHVRLYVYWFLSRVSLLLRRVWRWFRID